MMVLNGAMLPVVEKWDIYSAVLRILKLSVITMQICAWLVTFHASYYSLSYRIRLLVEKLATDDRLLSATTISRHEPSTRTIQRQVRTCASIFDNISLAATELKSAFSFSVLLILTLQMIICSCSLFFCIYSYYYTLLPERIYVFGSLFSFSVITIIIIITTVESPVNQVLSHLLKVIKNKFSN